jgi:hypothetical protein
LGACVIDSVVATGSTPREVSVYATTWNEASRAVGGLPLAQSGDGPAYLIWVTGELKPDVVVASPSSSGQVSGVWIVEPTTRPTAVGSAACAGSDSGDVTGSKPDLSRLGQPVVMPAQDYTAPAPPSSP